VGRHYIFLIDADFGQLHGEKIAEHESAPITVHSEPARRIDDDWRRNILDLIFGPDPCYKPKRNGRRPLAPSPLAGR
jgi:hypothetical protein